MQDGRQALVELKVGYLLLKEKCSGEELALVQKGSPEVHSGLSATGDEEFPRSQIESKGSAEAGLGNHFGVE